MHLTKKNGNMSQNVDRELNKQLCGYYPKSVSLISLNIAEIASKFLLK